MPCRAFFIYLSSTSPHTSYCNPCHISHFASRSSRCTTSCHLSTPILLIPSLFRIAPPLDPETSVTTPDAEIGNQYHYINLNDHYQRNMQRTCEGLVKDVPRYHYFPILEKGRDVASRLYGSGVRVRDTWLWVLWIFTCGLYEGMSPVE